MQDFERELALSEVESLFGCEARWVDGVVCVEGEFAATELRRAAGMLGLASALTNGSVNLETSQYRLEVAAGGGARKVTSHALHGLHAYKGKFYPQLARGLINSLGVDRRGVVLDPFAGCGTTVVEAALTGRRGVGVDVNPVGVLVSQAKLELLGTPLDEVVPCLESVLRGLDRSPSGSSVLEDAYLQRWLPEQNLRHLASALQAIGALPDGPGRMGAMAVLSSVIRSCSWQDPRQLRVYRRKSASGIRDLRDLYRASVNALIEDLFAIQRVVNPKAVARTRSRVAHVDARELASGLRSVLRKRADAIVTSPPYASALPYIDTDRLSLRAFGLLPGGSQRRAEELLIGNREIGTGEQRRLDAQLREELLRPTWLPSVLQDPLAAAVGIAEDAESGFRRRKTPALLFKYFLDMRRVLHELSLVAAPSAPVAIVIADNEISSADGSTVAIPTVRALQAIALGMGYSSEGRLAKRLTSYGAPDTVHQRNAMASEQVLLLRGPENGSTR